MTSNEQREDQGSSLSVAEASQWVKSLCEQMGQRFVGRNEVLELVLGAFFSGGHVLIEDVPGVGKTTLARTFSECFELDFQRVQFTPDLMPTDVLGVSVYEAGTGKFNFMKGPIFTHILMADEINRTSPKTQSSLLEAMEEGQVTIDGKRYVLSKPFMVIATQNPIEFEGTFPLPEAQMDRFLVRVEIGYPAMHDELQIYKLQTQRTSGAVQRQLTVAQIDQVKQCLEGVSVSEAMLTYVHMLVSKTRSHQDAYYGLSPRGGIALVKMAKWAALTAGRAYVIPEDVRKMAEPVMRHRLVLKPEALYRGQTIPGLVDEVMKTTAVPKGNL